MTAQPPPSASHDSGATEAEIDKSHPLGTHLTAFITRIDSLADTFPLTTLAIRRARRDGLKRFEAFLNTKLVRDPTKNNVFHVPQESHSEFMRLKRQIDKAVIAETSVPTSFLVALVSEFDAFLSGLIRILFILQPNALNVSDKTFSYSDVAEFVTMEAFREHVIDKQIETVLRDSHAEQFKWFESRFKVELRKGLNSWPAFIEITERRNLFVHNSGLVTKQYLDICHEYKVNCGEVKKGDRLGVDRSYFNRSHAIIFELAAKLTHVLWRKLDPKERDAADAHFAGQVVYDLLVQDRNELAAVMADFGIEVFGKFKGSSDLHNKTLTVNRAQAYKWLGKQALCNEILDKQDWSAAKDDFRLCVAVLRNNFSEAIEILRSMGPLGKPGKLDYREWPVFRELRANSDFQKAYEEVFGESLNLVSTDKESGNGDETLTPPDGTNDQDESLING